MCMKVTGVKIRPLEMGRTSMKMELSTQGNGRMTSKMVMERSNGQMDRLFKESIRTERRRKVNSIGLMVPHIMVPSRIIKLMEPAIMSGQTERSTRDSGRTINFMAEENSLSKMEGFIKDSISMIRSMVRDVLLGLMEDAIKVAGKTVNNMELAYIKVTQKAPQGKESGKTERESIG